MEGLLAGLRVISLIGFVMDSPSLVVNGDFIHHPANAAIPNGLTLGEFHVSLCSL